MRRGGVQFHVAATHALAAKAAQARVWFVVWAAWHVKAGASGPLVVVPVQDELRRLRARKHANTLAGSVVALTLHVQLGGIDWWPSHAGA